MTTLGRVAYSPDGRWLAATSLDDHDLRVWELAKAEPARADASVVDDR